MSIHTTFHRDFHDRIFSSFSLFCQEARKHLNSDPCLVGTTVAALGQLSWDWVGVTQYLALWLMHAWILFHPMS